MSDELEERHVTTTHTHTHTIASRRSMVTNENILSSTIFFTYQLIGAEFVA